MAKRTKRFFLMKGIRSDETEWFSVYDYLTGFTLGEKIHTKAHGEDVVNNYNHAHEKGMYDRLSEIHMVKGE